MMNGKQTSDELQVVNFTLDDVNYGVPVEQVREVRDILSVMPVPGAPDHIIGVTNLRGQVIPVMDLRRRLGIARKDKSGESLIVIGTEKALVGVIVDSVTEVSTINASDLEKDKEALGALGESIIGIGKQQNRLTIILDVADILAKARKKAIPAQ